MRFLPLPLVIGACIHLSGCMLTTSTESVTKAKLRRIVDITANCSLPLDAENRTYRCVDAYAIEMKIPIESLIMDAYDQRIVLHSDTCASPQERPYSKGRNGHDECGRGDDITIR